jgi:hypothetical protein
MKKVVAVLMILTMVLGLMACGVAEQITSAAEEVDKSESLLDSTEPVNSEEAKEEESVETDTEESVEADTTVDGEENAETKSGVESRSDLEYPFIEPIIPEEMSIDINSLEFALNGKVFKMPVYYQDFLAEGWECDVDISAEMLGSGFMTIGNPSIEKGKTSLAGVNFMNYGETESPLTACHIKGFAFFYDRYGSTETSFVLPGGIHIGSTIEDIKAAYGEPTETNEIGETIDELTYQFSDDYKIVFTVRSDYAPFGNRIRVDYDGYKLPIE